MQVVDISEVKSQLPQLLQLALRGEEIVITHNDHPVLKLIQVSSRFKQRQRVKRRQRGSAKGQIWMAPDFDNYLEDFNC
jgi:antitoxin (DNA-binding transcriptional repressor) of toxin-antitoxin stability system